MKQYDIVTGIDGERIETGMEMQEKIFARKIGQSTKIDVNIVQMPAGKAGKAQNLTLTVKACRG